jgi:hypothetical protein
MINLGQFREKRSMHQNKYVACALPFPYALFTKDIRLYLLTSIRSLNTHTL